MIIEAQRNESRPPRSDSASRVSTAVRPPRTLSSVELVGKAEDVVNSSNCLAPSLSEICRALRISPRKLHAAFIEVTGEAPAKWLRQRRLDKVRDRLQSPPSGEYLVKQAALAHGFRHLGRFSEQYRQRFGELPSDTMRLNATTDAELSV